MLVPGAAPTNRLIAGSNCLHRTRAILCDLRMPAAQAFGG